MLFSSANKSCRGKEKKEEEEKKQPSMTSDFNHTFLLESHVD